jgi:hypothetical protein
MGGAHNRREDATRRGGAEHGASVSDSRSEEDACRRYALTGMLTQTLTGVTTTIPALRLPPSPVSMQTVKPKGKLLGLRGRGRFVRLEPVRPRQKPSLPHPKHQQADTLNEFRCPAFVQTVAPLRSADVEGRQRVSQVG